MSVSGLSIWKVKIKTCLEIKIRTVPCASTFYNILSKIDVNIFENLIYEYIGKFETVYGITSLNTSLKHLLDLVRGHWGIENKSHWVRDVVFDEDRSRVENSNIAQFMASFRNLAITLIRLFVSNKISESIRFLNSKPELAFNLVLAEH